MKNNTLYVVVAIGGAAVLALEILGTRILGPFYGVSLYLWSALITVTLAALSVGYWVGGSWADKNPSPNRLFAIIGLAGIWVKYPFLHLTEPLGLRIAVLTASFVLFFPPLTLLGMISPFAIKLRTITLDEVGKSAGRLYAISTLASVGSALLTGFFLIPNVGVNRLTLSIGAILILTSLVGLFKTNKVLASTTMVLSLVLVPISWNVKAERPLSEQGLLEVVQSPYAEIRVFDNDRGRHLLIDGGIHTVVDSETYQSYLHYPAVMDLPKYFYDQPGTVLVLGLGGGSLVKQYASAFWKVDAVEIDPVIVEVAYKYFGLQPKESTISIMDARQYLLSTDKMYDVILLDAYGSSSIPFHLVTEEVFGLIKQRLTKKGMLAINVETVGWNDFLLNKVAATLKQHFSDIVALPMEEPPSELGNIVVLASNVPLVPLREPEPNFTLDPDWRYGPGYQKLHAWDNRFVPKTKGVLPFTDDLNSSDIYSENVNVVARKKLHEYFSKSGLSW